ncbi:MAG: energy-coupled thiamine transporter ThiT [Streptococcaceae bacterium]|nr:energy-coupled thiamine transporter ThiT [Streptococcaceae bacterium]
MSNSKQNITILAEIAVFAALSMLLALIPLDIGASFGINLGQVALTIFAIRRGAKPALLAGFIWGLLYFVIGKVWFLTLFQVLLEYPVAFTLAGLAGVYSKPIKAALNGSGNLNKALLIGTLWGIIPRYLIHFIAGFLFWGQYAQWGMGPVLFSAVANGTDAILTAVAVYLAIRLITLPNSKTTQNLLIP